MIDLFFELIRVALGTQASLSRLPSANEWDEIFELARKQSLIGITFFAIQQLGANADPSTGSGQALDEGYTRIGISEETYFTWAGLAAKVHVTNEIVDDHCLVLQNKLEIDGLRSCILKGQSAALLYPETLRPFRQSGDIDAWVDGDRSRLVAYVKERDHHTEKLGINELHVHYDLFDDTDVELHYKITRLANRWYDRKLQQWLEREKEDQMQHIVPFADSELCVPTVRFHIIYLLLHIHRHFFSEGIGLRQLMDLYFAIVNDGVSADDRKYVKETLASFGVTKFASGILWILIECFGLDGKKAFIEPNEHEGRFILDEIRQSGTFGKLDKRFRLHKEDSHIKHFLTLAKSKMRFWAHYPGECFWQPMEIFIRFFELKWLRMKV